MTLGVVKEGGMTIFQIFALVGLAGVIGVLLGIRSRLFAIERHLFGIRYQFPFIENADILRLGSIKKDNEETPGALDEWWEDCGEGKKPLLLYETYEIKAYLKSIDESLKRLNGETVKKSG